MPNPVEQWYFDIPVVTRVYLTASAAITLAEHFNYVTRFQLYYDFYKVFHKGEYWRLITTFLFYGGLDFDWVFNMYFVVRYMRDVEDAYTRNKTANFFWLILISCVSLLIVSSFFFYPFLASILNYTLTYIWARKNPYVVLSFFGLFTFSAPFLPWVMAVFSFIISGRTPMRDLIGIGVGHVLWYLDEEWPRRPESNGIRILEAPMFIKRLFGGARAEEYLDSGAQDSVPVTTDQSVPPLQANNEDDVSSHVTQPSAESSNTGGDANKTIQDGFKKPLTPSNESADDSMKDVFRESATYSKSSTPIDSKITSESTTTGSSTLKNDENDLRHRAK